MKSAIRTLMLAAVVALSMGGLTACPDGFVVAPPAPTQPGKYVYVNDNDAAGNTVSGFSIDPTTGALTSLGAPVPTGGTGSAGLFAANIIAVAWQSNLLFATNSGSNDISVFSIDPATGALALVGGPVSSATGVMGTSGSVVVNSNGTFLYVANNTTLDIAVFAIGAGGVLAEIAGSPFALGGVTADGIGLSPDGLNLYVTNGSSNTLDVFDVAVDGSLTLTAGSPFASGFTGNLASVEVNSSGVAIVGVTGGKFASYTLDAAGVPTFVQILTITGGNNEQSASLTPDGLRALISGGGGGGNIGVVDIAAGGVLTEVAGSVFATASPTISYARVHPNGQWVFVVENDGANNVVEGFVMDAAGVLTSMGAPVAAGNPNGNSVGLGIY